jgi:hypothetical protein
MIVTNLALARSVNYDYRFIIYDHKDLLRTKAYFTIVIYDGKTFIVQANGYLIKKLKDFSRRCLPKNILARNILARNIIL